MFTFTDDLREFVALPVAVLVGTGDSDRRPEGLGGWGPRVSGEHSLDVFLDAERADRTLANLRDNGRIAVTLAYPITHRSVQFKGRMREVAPPTPEDIEFVQTHREAFVVVTSLIGDPPEAIRAMWLDDVVRVTMEVEAAFDQTPGPGAGKPL